jgi:hypothetical protein
MGRSNLTIEEKVLSTLQGKEGQVFRCQEILEMVVKKYPGTNITSVIPSDYCYNIVNNGIKFRFHQLEQVSRGVYKYLGEGVKYNGLVYWKGSEYGEWKNGEFTKFKSDS